MGSEGAAGQNTKKHKKKKHKLLIVNFQQTFQNYQCVVQVTVQQLTLTKCDRTVSTVIINEAPWRPQSKSSEHASSLTSVT